METPTPVQAAIREYNLTRQQYGTTEEYIDALIHDLIEHKIAVVNERLNKLYREHINQIV